MLKSFPRSEVVIFEQDCFKYFDHSVVTSVRIWHITVGNPVILPTIAIQQVMNMILIARMVFLSGHSYQNNAARCAPDLPLDI